MLNSFLKPGNERDYSRMMHDMNRQLDFHKPILVPVHCTSPRHWFLLEIDVQSSVLRVLDSHKMARPSSYNRRLKRYKDWISRELGPGCAAKLQTVVANVPQQPSEDLSCGVYVCLFLKVFALGLDPEECFKNEHDTVDAETAVMRMRGAMLSEIAAGTASTMYQHLVD